MYMEPDGAESTHTEHQEPTQPQSDVVTILTVQEKPTAMVTSATNQEENVHDELPETTGKSLETESQNFFPSFAELFGNHRLPYTEHQQRYRPNRFLGYFQRERGYQPSASSTSSSKNSDHFLLGSGNFGVIPGGTYYPEKKENDEYSLDESVFGPFYQGSGGRGRTNYYRNPKPQPVRDGDIFAHFRDFADITAPPKSSFSHLSVVYANKNGNGANRGIEQPRNIIETLRMLEEQEQTTNAITTTEEPQKKLSQGKRKLQKMKKYEEEKGRKYRLTVEPLLALS